MVGDDLVGQAELVRLVGEDRVAGEVHLERLARPDQPRQPLGAAEAGDDPEVDLGLAEERRLGGDAHVAGHRQLAAAAVGDRVDRGDRHRRATARTPRSSPCARVEQLAAAGLVQRRERLDVGAGAEQHRVGRGDDERADARRPRPAPTPSASASMTSGDSELAGGLFSQAIATSPRVSSCTGPSAKPSSGCGHGKKPWPVFWPRRPWRDEARAGSPAARSARRAAPRPARAARARRRGR